MCQNQFRFFIFCYKLTKNLFYDFNIEKTIWKTDINMRILPVKLHSFAFSGRREDRNTTSQLAKNNDYALTENNQQRIEKAIENLGKEKGENNIKFLLNTAENLQYGTNISNSAKPRHDWKLQLKKAAQSSLAVSDPILKEKFANEISRVFDTQKPLTEDEKAILESKSFLLKHINKAELDGEKNANIKNIEKNLEHFIASSEIPLKQKRYILNRFEYLLSPDYRINPQLEDKRTVVLAELLNDIVVNTGSKIPNTKAINQKSHGMCAAISIARKLMSYEYKKDYVDTVLSELDDNNTMMVYDIADIGSGKKVPVAKTDINFIDAMNKGYRIVDASTIQWMNIADMTGVNNKPGRIYSGFDPENMGTFQDAHYLAPFADENLQSKQSYYQALITAKDKIDSAKTAKLERELSEKERLQRRESDLKMVQELDKSLLQELKSAIPSLTLQQAAQLKSNLLSLEVKLSSQIDKIKDDTKKYHFLPNEEDIVKKQKIKDFLLLKSPQKIDKDALEKHISSIKDIIEMSKSISEKIKPESTMAQKIRNDRKLFEAAAAYRTSLIFGLYDRDLRTDSMIHYNIPDSETILAQNISQTAEYIRKTADERFINHFSRTFNIEPEKETVLKLLSDLENTVNQALTSQMDQLYHFLGLNSRTADLLAQVKALKSAIEQKDNNELKNTAIGLGIKPDKAKVLEKLAEYEEILSNNPTQEEYTEIFNKLGNKSQLQTFADTYEIVSEELENADEETESQIIENLNKAHNLPENAPIQDSKNALYKTAQLFNQISGNISMIRDVMTIEDENGRLLNTANPNALITAAMEKEGRILRGDELAKLYSRYSAIDKIRSQDEFSSRQGKISDPALYKYTEPEKETIKKIKKSLNAMAADTNRELVSIFREIKNPLEEAARQDGIDSGNYWAMPEAKSGLYSTQQAKILQQLTGKPYQITEDLEKGFKSIKNTPNSGITGTNVFHDQPGGHAMYVAEISNHNGKEIIYHDNSWGASEHENIWVDSEGLTRTDYSDNRGGKLGYITNNKWQNGNYINNIANTSGKFRPEHVASKQINKLKNETPYDFPMLRDFIIPGVPNSKANDLAAAIKDTIFMPDTIFIDDFEKLAQNITVGQVKAAKTAGKTAIDHYYKEIRLIDDRLEVTPFNKGVTSKQAYDRLADNDILKVVFEKAAFEKSYDFSSKWKELAKINSVKELEPLKAEQKKSARENFEYAFAKDPKILYAYALNKNKNHLLKILNTVLEQNNIKVTEKQQFDIVQKTAMYEKGEIMQFDGSLKTTIDFMVNKVLAQFDKTLPSSPQTQKAREQLRTELTKDLSNGLYFNLHDLEKDTDLQVAIKNYIDRKYNPETDEEFVEIYKKLQNMTTEEFRKETADASDEDMALKNISGYEILQKYTSMNEPIRNLVSNLVFQKHLLGAINLSETETSYKYKKLQKKVSGATYVKGRTYDDLYRTFNLSLQSLTYKRMFNKNKADAYRKYGAFPAYPYIDILDNTMLKAKLEQVENIVHQSLDSIKSGKINLFAYEQTEKAENFLDSLPENKKMTTVQREILNTIAGEFVSANYDDQNIARSVNSAQQLLELPADATVKEFKAAFEPWRTEITAIKNLSSTKDIQDSIKVESMSLKEKMNILVDTDIPKRFRGTVKNALNDWINEEIKGAGAFYDKLLEKRIIESKISQNSTNNLTDKAKTAFIDKLGLQIQKLKNALIAQRYNAISTNMHYVNMLNSMLEVANEFLDAENQQIFSEKITEISRRTEKLTKDEIAAAVLNELQPLTSTKNPEKSRNFNSLVKNLHNLNRELAAKQGFEASVKNAQEKLNFSVEKFITDYINPEAQEALRIKIAEYVQKELTTSKKAEFNSDRADELYRIFEEKYKKYHLVNYPMEILDRFAELSAKDSEIETAPTPIVKNRLITEREMNKNYLDTTLSIAALIDIQEQLMEAENLGNASFAASKFKNYDIPMLINTATGMSATMSDDEAVDYMVRALILKNDNRTAQLFVEKLGLTEKFLKIEEKMLDVEAHKKNIRKIGNILKVTNLQNNAIKAEMEKFNEGFDDAQNYEEIIETAKQNLRKKTEKLARKKNIELVIDTLEEAKKMIRENPDIPKSLVINQALNSALSYVGEATNNDLTKLQTDLRNLSIIYDLIQSLDIPEYSPAQKYREEIDKKYTQIINYNEEILSKAARTSDIVKLTNDI